MGILNGVKVIDFTQAYSGPFCTMQLADFGAEVIKIERRGVGDQSREWTPFRNGYSGYYASINRNKKGVSLDISKPEGQEVAKRLISQADIVVENFKVGTLAKMGLDYESIKKINPQIIYASISGFGQYGSLKNLAAYDNVVQAMTGVVDMTGFPDGVPVKIGPAIGDHFTGLNTCLGILMAYYSRLETGMGQHIDTAMFDTLFGICECPILFKTLLDVDMKRSGNADPEVMVPYDVYKCKDGYFSAGLVSESAWPTFCNTIGNPDLADNPKFATAEGRSKNFEEATEIISTFFVDKTRSELTDIFAEAKIPSAPVMTIPELMHNEHLLERGMIRTMYDDGLGEYEAITNPMHLSLTPADEYKSAPLMGQHTEEILEKFQFNKAEIAELYEKGVI